MATLQSYASRANAFSSAFDGDGDGKITVDELMGTLDADGSGTLDTSELKPLLDRLNQQMQFNNELIERLSALETANLAQGREMKENYFARP